MIEHILIIDGHPDPAPERFVHALAETYREGAEANRLRKVRATLIGNVANLSASARQGHLNRMEELGRRAR